MTFGPSAHDSEPTRPRVGRARPIARDVASAAGRPIGDLLALQRSAGNAAVGRLLARSSSQPLQRKLGKGLPPQSEVVRHEEPGDVSGFKIQKTIFGTYTINGPGESIHKSVSAVDASWSTVAGAEAGRLEWQSWRAEKAKAEEADKLRKELIVGENYLSADYRRINPLLAAFERQGYTSAQVRDKAFDYGSKKLAILADMKEIAVTRKYADVEGAASWTVDEVDSIYKMLRTILDVWEKFPTPKDSSGKAYARVYRGDSRFLFDSFPQLNPATNKYVDGENAVSFDIVMPGILSTTYGDPKTHNYVKGKTVVWDIKLPEGNEGKGLGTNNQSEQEISFPIGARLHVISLLVREKDKTAQADVYGSDATVVVKAEMAV